MPSPNNLKFAPARLRAAPEDRMKRLSLDVMDEIVAGLLWMHLNVPKDASRDELQDYAHEVVRQARTGAPEAAIADFIGMVQLDRLCELPNLPVIRELARRIVGTVRQAGPSLRNAA